jgi:phospholipase C
MSAAAVTLGLGVALSVPAMAGAAQAPSHHNAGGTTTPIKHLVVIFQENVSFDHYFGTLVERQRPEPPGFRSLRFTPGSGQRASPVLPAGDRRRLG